MNCFSPTHSSPHWHWLLTLTHALVRFYTRWEKYVNKSGTNVVTGRSLSGDNYLAGGKAIISEQSGLVTW